MLFWLTIAIVWTIALLFAVIPGAIVGIFAKYLLGAWAYWPGFALGMCLFLYHMRPWLFFWNERARFKPVRAGTSLLPFLLGILIGREFLSKGE